MQKNLIINEKRFVEDIISSTTLSEDITVNNAINYMTRYYTEYTDLSLEDITKVICDKMESFNLSITVYQPHKATARIKRIYNAVKLDKLNNLRDIDSIPLYKSEFDLIMQCNNDREKKVLFTLYILARYTNRYGWVYQPESDIYKLSNVSTTTKNQPDIFYSLLKKGFIKDTKKVDDLKVGVNLSDGNEDVVLEVTEIKSLGNLLLVSISDKHKQCECCGKMIRIKSKFKAPKYCTGCAEKIQFEQKKQWDQDKKTSKSENT